MSPKDRATVGEFISVVRAEREYRMLGFAGFDPTSATLMPAWKSLSELNSVNYVPHVVVTLPIFRLFSPQSQIGIIAHEFAHAWRASQMGKGWHEKMVMHYAAEERLADALAKRWGFDANIRIMRDERRRIVNPLLEAREPAIIRRMLRRAQQQQDAALQRFDTLTQEK